MFGRTIVLLVCLRRLTTLQAAENAAPPPRRSKVREYSAKEKVTLKQSAEEERQRKSDQMVEQYISPLCPNCDKKFEDSSDGYVSLEEVSLPEEEFISSTRVFKK